jgi:hypothetical protein
MQIREGKLQNLNNLDDHRHPVKHPDYFKKGRLFPVVFFCFLRVLAMVSFHLHLSFSPDNKKP